MKAEVVVPKSWDDLVFENRHRAYGAYELRKNYSGNLASGFLLSIGLGVAAVAVPLMASMFGEDQKMSTIVIAQDSTITKFTEPPSIEPPQPPVAPPPTPAAAQSLHVQVTDQPVADPELPTVDDINHSLDASPDGEPGGVPTPSTGIGTVPEPMPVVEPPKVVDFAEEMPAYEGGLEAMYKFIKKKVKYPGSAQRTGLEGTVYVSFVVDKDGNVTDVKVVRGISADCDKEAARVIALLPAWKAGRQNHNPVSVRMTLPIKFQMSH